MPSYQTFFVGGIGKRRPAGRGPENMMVWKYDESGDLESELIPECYL
jgi:hypothetical protein